MNGLNVKSTSYHFAPQKTFLIEHLSTQYNALIGVPGTDVLRIFACGFWLVCYGWAMSKGTPKITKSSYRNEVLTRGKMDPIVADLKDFIKTTVKGTENVLRSEIGAVKKELAGVKVTVEAHSNAIMELSRDVRGLKSDVSELKSDVGGLRSDVKRLDNKIDDVRSELSGKIDGVETRLSGKIDKIGERLDDHETRITTLETARL